MSVVVAGPGRVRETRRARTVVVKTVPADPFDRLTEREWDVVRARCRCRTRAEAAHELFLSMTTLRGHLTSIFRKFGLSGAYPEKMIDICYRLGRRDEREGVAS